VSRKERLHEHAPRRTATELAMVLARELTREFDQGVIQADGQEVGQGNQQKVAQQRQLLLSATSWQVCGRANKII
jgi:hypothetical protein